jgi:AraC family transcriptional regulator of adaptative response / methylphosphotriester-DNA alkyltransferase methyltransferase
MVDDAVYDAVIHHRRDYDGLFYIGIRSTKIVCFPSCRSRTPKRENIVIFPTVKEAVRSGYRPCKRCRPDPSAAGTPAMRLAQAADHMLTLRFPAKMTNAELAAAFYVSPRHLTRVYREIFGCSLGDRRTALWLAEAKRLLEQERVSLMEVSHRLTATSPAIFSRRFRQCAGMTPTQYRRTVQGG